MKTFLTFICNALCIICNRQHMLPDWLDEYLQKVWTLIFGYYCPFVIWSVNIKDRYGLYRNPSEPTRDRWPDYPIPDVEWYR